MTDPFHLVTSVEYNWRQNDIEKYLWIERSLQTQNSSTSFQI